MSSLDPSFTIGSRLTEPMRLKLGLSRNDARVLDLLKKSQEATGVAYLFISYALTVVRHLSHPVAVMYRGEKRQLERRALLATGQDRNAGVG